MRPDLSSNPTTQQDDQSSAKDGDVLCQGFLLKRSRKALFKRWKRRFFVMSEHELSYFEGVVASSFGPVPINAKGVYSLDLLKEVNVYTCGALSGFEVVLFASERCGHFINSPRKDNEISVTSGLRRIVLTAQSEEKNEQWVHLLRRRIATPRILANVGDGDNCRVQVSAVNEVPLCYPADVPFEAVAAMQNLCSLGTYAERVAAANECGMPILKYRFSVSLCIRYMERASDERKRAKGKKRRARNSPEDKTVEVLKAAEATILTIADGLGNCITPLVTADTLHNVTLCSLHICTNDVDDVIRRAAAIAHSGELLGCRVRDRNNPLLADWARAKSHDTATVTARASARSSTRTAPVNVVFFSTADVPDALRRARPDLLGRDLTIPYRIVLRCAKGERDGSSREYEFVDAAVAPEELYGTLAATSPFVRVLPPTERACITALRTALARGVGMEPAAGGDVLVLATSCSPLARNVLRVALQRLDPKLERERITVFESGALAGAEGLLAAEACALADSGLTLPEIVPRLELLCSDECRLGGFILPDASFSDSAALSTLLSQERPICSATKTGSRKTFLGKTSTLDLVPRRRRHHRSTSDAKTSTWRSFSRARFCDSERKCWSAALRKLCRAVHADDPVDFVIQHMGRPERMVETESWLRSNFSNIKSLCYATLSPAVGVQVGLAAKGIAWKVSSYSCSKKQAAKRT